jgi:hypothetical protein
MKSSRIYYKHSLSGFRLRIKSQKLNRLLRNASNTSFWDAGTRFDFFLKGETADWSLLCDALGGAIQEI